VSTNLTLTGAAQLAIAPATSLYVQGPVNITSSSTLLVQSPSSMMVVKGNLAVDPSSTITVPADSTTPPIVISGCADIQGTIDVTARASDANKNIPILSQNTSCSSSATYTLKGI